MTIVIDAKPRGSGEVTRLLIAEDDPRTRELLVELVEELGYTTNAVPNGETALAAVQAEPPALVLSDVTMPAMDGFELCRRLKADPMTRLIPVILITGIGEEFKAAGIDAGADDFLSKPVSRAELTIRLRALLRMRAFTDELESVETVLFSLAKTVEAKDTVTGDHCERLATMVVTMGRRLNLEEADLRALHHAGYLHDVGKVGIPDRILCKPGPLIPEEWQVMRRHPLIGEALCRPLRSLRRVLPIIRHHHERWDGSGYPDGLRGEAIPLTARVLQVADVYDALRSDRRYRAALSPDAALGIVAAETQKGWWDPVIVAKLEEMLAAIEGARAGGV